MFGGNGDDSGVGERVRGQNVRYTGPKQFSSKAAIAKTLQCSNVSISYEPIDMDLARHPLTQEPDVAACQARCEQVEGCAYFSYWERNGDCHLQNIYAVWQPSRLGFISGPPSCVKSSGEAYSTVISMLQQQACFEEGVQYTPVEGGDRVPGQVRDVLECQRVCQSYSWCAHWSFNALTYYCNLETAEASPLADQRFMTAGPKTCQGLAWLRFSAGLDWRSVPSGTNLREAFESAITRAVLATSPEASKELTMVITDRARRGLHVMVVIASPQSTSIRTITNSINDRLSLLQSNLEKEIVGIPNITADTVVTVDVDSAAVHSVSVDNRKRKSTHVEIERLTPSFVSTPFAGIGMGSASRAQLGVYSDVVGVAVKSQELSLRLSSKGVLGRFSAVAAGLILLSLLAVATLLRSKARSGRDRSISVGRASDVEIGGGSASYCSLGLQYEDSVPLPSGDSEWQRLVREVTHEGADEFLPLH